VSAALDEGVQAVEGGLRERAGVRDDDGAEAVAAEGFEGAGAGFEDGGDGVLVDDVEVDLVFGEQALGGDEGIVGGGVAHPEGCGGQQQRD
jgi:hypothetical protein